MESDPTTKLIQPKKILPVVEFGRYDASQTIVFLPGFPDNQTSAWGNLLQDLIPSDKQSACRIICMCIPDYEENSVPKPWGWSFKEIVELIESTIQHHIPDVSRKFVLIVHDWGSIIGLNYQNRNPSRVEKLVMFDVGIGLSPGKQYCSTFIVVLYQFWWSLAYILSQSLSKSAGRCCFQSFFRVVPSCCQPTPFEDSHAIAVDDVEVHTTYIYYRFWRGILCARDEGISANKFPGCPLLYMYGTEKNVMFHNEAFLERIESTPGCRAVAVEGGHWMTYGRTAGQVTKEIKEFLNMS